jgi:tRNA-Thr(GGU) m(6)t(6)A37 methyltransferase TsaA
MNPLTLHPIAILRTPFAEKFGVPRQSGLVPEAEGRVEFLPEFAAPEFTRGLEAFSHVWLITAFHKNPAWTGSAVVRPPRLGGNERVGVFASRSPNRPNPLGLSLVRIIALEPGVLRVAGIDAVDGTPVYDVKPYLPWTEAVPEARSDWAPTAPGTVEDPPVIIPESMAARMGEPTTRLVRQLLRLQLQPAYHETESRTYGMTVSGWNVRWRVLPDGRVEVCEANPA